MFSSNSVGQDSSLSNSFKLSNKDIIVRVNGESGLGTGNDIIVDSSNTNASLTKTGYVTQGPYSPFSAYGNSVSFDGNYDHLHVNNPALFNFNTADFTVDFFICPQRWGTIFGNAIAGQKANDTSECGWVVYNNTSNNGSKIVMRLGNGNSTDFPSNSDVVNGVWQHWRFSRKNGVVYWFKDGVLDATSNSVNYQGNINSNTYMVIGTSQVWSNKYQGKISCLHIQKGVGYSENFSVPTDANCKTAYTVFLGLCSNTFKDFSDNNLTLYKNYYPDITDGPFEGTYSPDNNGGSYFFSGSSSHIKIPGLSNLKNLTGDYTIEFWFKPIKQLTQQTLLYLNGDSNGYREFEVRLLATDVLTVQSHRDGGNVTITLPAIPFFQWNHLAIVSNGVGFIVYLNGVNVGSTAVGNSSVILNYVTSNLGAYNNTLYYYRGYISGFRIVSSKVYTSNFSLPTKPPEKLPNTQLLLLGNNSNIIDIGYKNNIYVNGAISLDTSIVKNGAASININSAGALLISPASVTYDVQGRVSNSFSANSNFSCEANVYLNSHAGDRVIVSTVPDAAVTNRYFALLIAANGEIKAKASGAVVSTGFIVPVKEWFHLAFARYNNTGYFYYNGEMVYSFSYNNDLFSYYLSLGGNSNNTELVNGRLDDILVTFQNRLTNNIVARSGSKLNEFVNNSTNKNYQYEVLSLKTDPTFVKDIVDLSGTNTVIDKQLTNIAFSLYSPYSRGKKSLHLNGNSTVKFTQNNIYNHFGKKNTIEAIIFPAEVVGGNGYQHAIINNLDASGSIGQVGVYISAGALPDKTFRIGLYTVNGNTHIYSTITGHINKWNHIVVQLDCRTPGSTNELIFYINGVREVRTINFTGLTSSSFPNGPLHIGGNSYYINNFIGNIYGLRIVQSNTDYVYNNATIDFPSNLDTVLPGTVFHLNTDTCFMIDKGPNKHQLIHTTTGATMETCMVPYSPYEIQDNYNADVNGGSALFFSAVDSSYVPITKVSSPNISNCNWVFGTGDYTIDLCVSWPNVATGNERIITLTRSDGVEYLIGRNGSQLRTFWNSTLQDITHYFGKGTWHHIALVKKSGVIKVYLDGRVVKTFNDTVSFTVKDFRIGMKPDQTEVSRCHLTHIHITNNALYDGDFIPSNSNVTPTANSKLLFKFQGGNIVDMTGNYTVVPKTPDINMLNGPYLGSEGSVQGVYPINLNTAATNSGISFIGNRHINFGTGDYTIEFNYKKTRSTASVTGLLRDSLNGSNIGNIFISDASNVLNCYMSSSGGSADIANNLVILNPLVIGNEYNIVIRKTGMNYNFYVNGILRNTLKSNLALKAKPTFDLALGSIDPTVTNPGGEVSQLRITLGKRKYISEIIDI